MEIADIDVSLSRGNLLDKGQRLVAYSTITICCLFPILTIILLIVVPQNEWDARLTFVLVGVNVLSALLISLMSFVIVKNKRLIKNVTLWLKDAVALKAYSKKLGENRLGIQPKAAKIQVEFQFEGKTYKRASTYKVFGGVEGYVGCFNKYADRYVSILYSPKYDEVLILKNNECID